MRISVAAVFRHIPFVQERPARNILASIAFHLLLFLGVAILLCVTALIALANSNRDELLRRIAILHLHAITKREVHLEAVRLDLTGAVTLTNLRIADTQQQTYPLLSARAVQVQFDPLHYLAFPRRYLSGIRQVRLEQPFLLVTRDAQSRWNFDDLIQKKKPRPYDHFGAEVLIEDGEVIYRDAHGWMPGKVKMDEHLVGVSARMIQAKGGYLPFRLTGTSTAGQVKALLVTGAVHLKEKRAECQVRFGDIDLRYVQQFLPQTLPLTLESGRADGRWQITVAQDPQTQQLHAKMTILADVNDVRGQLKLPDRTLPYVVSQGQIRLAPDVLELVGVNAQTSGVPLTVEGTISRFAHPVLALQIKTERADAQRLSAVIPGMAQPGFVWGGTVTGWAQLTGPLEALQVSGSASGPSLLADFGGTRGAFHDLRGDIRYHGTTLELAQLSGRAFGGAFSGHAWLALDEQSRDAEKTALLFQGYANAVQADELQRFLTDNQGERTLVAGMQVAGTVSGPVSMTLSQAGAFSLIAHVGGYLSVPEMIEGAVEAHLRVDVAENRPALTTIDRLTMRTVGGEVRLQGTVADDRLALVITGNGLDLHKLAAQAAPVRDLVRRSGQGDFRGTGFVTATVGGTLAAPDMSGVFRAQHGSFAGREFSELSSQFAMTTGPATVLTLRDLRLLSGNRQLELSATELTATLSNIAGEMGQWQVRQAKLSRSRLSSLAALIGLDLQIDGFVEGTIEMADFPDEAGGRGKLILNRPSLRLGQAQLSLDRATVDFVVHDEHTLEISNAQLEYEGLPEKKSVFTIAGRISKDPKLPPNEQLALHVTGRRVPVENLAVFANDHGRVGMLAPDGRVYLPFSVEGSVDLDAQISGQFVDPQSQVAASEMLARSLVMKGELLGDEDFTIASVPYRQFAVRAEYHGREHTVALSQFILAPADGKRDYRLVAEPGLCRFSQPSLVSLRLSLESAKPGKDGQRGAADLVDLRNDLSVIAHHSMHGSLQQSEQEANASLLVKSLAPTAPAAPHSPLTGVYAALARYLDSAPAITGKAVCAVDVRESLEHPKLRTTLSAHGLTVNGQEMPTLEADLAFDAQQREFTVNHLVARGGPDPDALIEVEKDSTIALPGAMNLRVNAHKINPALFGRWFPGHALEKIGGEVDVTISTMEGATTAQPQFEASLEWFDPSVNGVAFDSVLAFISLENDPHDPTIQRLWIGQHLQGDEGYVAIPLKGASKGADTRALELSGSLPFRWSDLPASPFPQDKPFSLMLRIPQQSFALLKEYMPTAKPLPVSDDGTVEGCLKLGGTLAQVAFADEGYLLVKNPEVTLPEQYVQFPKRLTDVVLDVSFHAEHVDGEVENVIEVNRFSASGERQPDTRTAWQRLGGAIKSLFGTEKKQPQMTPYLFAGGSIRILPSKTKQPWPSVQDLRYDLYARTTRFPLSAGHMFTGRVASYLHLRNRPNGTPLLTGVIKADESTIMYASDSSAEFIMPKLPVDPELSLLIQVGQKNAFVIEPNNAILRGSMSADLPLKATGAQLFPADDVADPATVAYRQGEKLYLEPSLLYDLHADSLPPQDDEIAAGSYGKLRGHLSRPIIDFNFVLVPRKSQVQLPGGLLVVDKAKGVFQYELGSQTRAILNVEGEATSNIDQYVITAKIDGDLLQQLDDRSHSGAGRLASYQNVFPIDFTARPMRSGVVPLTDQDQIYARLIGVPDFLDLLRGKENLFSPSFVNMVSNSVLRNPLRMLGSSGGLESLSVRLDKYDKNWFPEATLTTPEFLTSKWSAFRLGATRTFSEEPTWKTWLVYSIPEPRYRWLRDLTLTGEVDEKKKVNYNLQYQIQFSTSHREDPSSAEEWSLPGPLSDRFLLPAE